MQRKYRIILVLAFFFLVPLLVFMINTRALEENGKPQKGDLRCPTNTSSNVKCEEIKNNQGVTTAVEFTYKVNNEDGEINVVKKVTKKEPLGHYDVEFEVSGEGVKQKPSAAPAYIAVIIDMSVTASDQKSAMTDAVLRFGNVIVPVNDSSDYQLALVKFGGSSSFGQKFSNKNFNRANFKGGLGSTSHIELSLKDVYNVYKDLPDDMKKYVVIFGDGRYWYTGHTGTSDAIKYAKNLRNKGTKIYGIRYNGSCPSCKMGQYNAALRLGCKKGEKYYACDEIMMKLLVDKYYSPTSDLTKLFEDIANEILEETGNATITTELKDNVGDDFYLTEGDGRYKMYNVGRLTKEGTKVGPFEIEIDQYAEEGWHETNNSFTITYTKDDGEKKTLTFGENPEFNDNPEVYWVPTDLTIHSCSGSVTADSLRDDEGDEYSFFTRTCYEGYLENDQYIPGFTAMVKVNNLNDGDDKFNLLSGIGFPTNISLSTNIVCRYKFDSEAFLKKYNELESEINASEVNSPAWYSLVKERDEKVLKSLESYLEIIDGAELKSYEGRFKDQSATMTIKYTDNKSIDTGSFENKGDIKSSINCEDLGSTSVLGKRVPTNQTCKASFSKEMQLKEVCLNMKTGEAESCTDSDNQIVGGNKFYIKLQQTGGNVSVNIPNAGYRENLDINLRKEGDEKGCDFTASKKFENIVYRQIDVSDPFIQNYNGSRKVGENYLNTKNKSNANYKYNFVNIIQKDIWDKDGSGNLKYKFDYKYTMGKQNVLNIRKDTKEEGASSYLGRRCYFNQSNQYVCDFTRNTNSNNNLNDQEWFYNYEINVS